MHYRRKVIKEVNWQPLLWASILRSFEEHATKQGNNVVTNPFHEAPAATTSVAANKCSEVGSFDGFLLPFPAHLELGYDLDIRTSTPSMYSDLYPCPANDDQDIINGTSDSNCLYNSQYFNRAHHWTGSHAQYNFGVI
jgi:hypothetical protein